VDSLGARAERRRCDRTRVALPVQGVRRKNYVRHELGSICRTVGRFVVVFVRRRASRSRPIAGYQVKACTCRTCHCSPNFTMWLDEGTALKKGPGVTSSSGCPRYHFLGALACISPPRRGRGLFAFSNVFLLCLVLSSFFRPPSLSLVSPPLLRASRSSRLLPLCCRGFGFPVSAPLRRRLFSTV